MKALLAVQASARSQRQPFKQPAHEPLKRKDVAAMHGQHNWYGRENLHQARNDALRHNPMGIDDVDGLLTNCLQDEPKRLAR